MTVEQLKKNIILHCHNYFSIKNNLEKYLERYLKL